MKEYKIKNKSTITSLECIVEHICWMFMISIYYVLFLFIPYKNYTPGKSRPILFGCMAIASVVGCAIRWNRHMTKKSAVADVIVGMGIYTILVYAPYYLMWIISLAIIFFAFVITYSVYLFTRRVKGEKLLGIGDRRIIFFIIKRRIVKILDVAGIFLGMLTIVMLIPIGYNRMVNGGIIAASLRESVALLPPTKGYDLSYAENEMGLAHNLETIEKIRENARWMPLTPKEKLQVIQAVCDCEINYFGMGFSVTVVVDDLSQYSYGSYATYGTYDDSEKLVAIDRQLLESGDAHMVLDTCLHEMYHAWEHCLVRLYLDSTEEQRRMRVFMYCEEYLNEIKDFQRYEGSKESYDGYYSQYMEQASRSYARNKVLEYYREIDKLQGNFDKYQGKVLD